VTTPRELLSKVRFHAWALMIASTGDIPFAEAERTAAKLILAEQRARPKPAAFQPAAPATEAITVKNARQVLTDRVFALAERMKAFAAEPVREKPHTEDPMTAFAPRAPRVSGGGADGGVYAPQPGTRPDGAPSPPSNQTLVFTGNSATSQMIADREYHRSITCQDRTTDNWRASIKRNEQIARMKRGIWIG
jgi:hypothetical protein